MRPRSNRIDVFIRRGTKGPLREREETERKSERESEREKICSGKVLSLVTLQTRKKTESPNQNGISQHFDLRLPSFQDCKKRKKNAFLSHPVFDILYGKLSRPIHHS